MAARDKPYRVYRGGRTKGKVPLQRRPERMRPGDGRAVVRRPRQRWGWGRRIAVGVAVLVVLLIVWAIGGYLSVRKGVADANSRLPEGTQSALAKDNGILVAHSTNILLLGTDHAEHVAGRNELHHSDSILLLRTDPGRHRLVYLSIPRDLRVEIPGYGANKINSAMQIGGPKLAVQTVRTFTGLPVNHVVVVDFGEFKDLIDAIGGIEVNVPDPILSNKFDCPYSASRCAQWEGWRFRKGTQHMDGKRALIYSRIRENRLNPAESDLTRGERQQQVLNALMSKLASTGTFFRLPFIGGKLLKPLATDLSTWQFMQLGWDKFRASSSSTLHCRLGGSASSIGGQSFIVGTEENIAVIQMVLGRSAAQPPPPGSGPFGPGCVKGSLRLH